MFYLKITATRLNSKIEVLKDLTNWSFKQRPNLSSFIIDQGDFFSFFSKINAVRYVLPIFSFS